MCGTEVQHLRCFATGADFPIFSGSASWSCQSHRIRNKQNRTNLSQKEHFIWNVNWKSETWCIFWLWRCAGSKMWLFSATCCDFINLCWEEVDSLLGRLAQMPELRAAFPALLGMCRCGGNHHPSSRVTRILGFWCIPHHVLSSVLFTYPFIYIFIIFSAVIWWLLFFPSISKLWSPKTNCAILQSFTRFFDRMPSFQLRWRPCHKLGFGRRFFRSRC